MSAGFGQRITGFLRVGIQLQAKFRHVILTLPVLGGLLGTRLIPGQLQRISVADVIALGLCKQSILLGFQDISLVFNTPHPLISGYGSSIQVGRVCPLRGVVEVCRIAY